MKQVRWWIGLAAVSAFAQSFWFEPARPLQGQVLRVYGSAPAETARLNGRTVRLFPQSDGKLLGLMPVGVLTKPGIYDLEWLDRDRAVHREPVRIASAHFKRQNIVLNKRLSALHSTPEERQTVAAFLKTASPKRFWQEPLEAPIPGCITSPFGVVRLHNGKLTGDYHGGLDQRGAFGSPVHAIASGVVKIVQPFELRGGTVAIDHGQGLESLYLHLSKFAAKEGDHVERGAVIGYVGTSGRSTAPHLHWTLYANGVPINPLQWMKLAPCAAAHTAKKRPK